MSKIIITRKHVYNRINPVCTCLKNISPSWLENNIQTLFLVISHLNLNHVSPAHHLKRSPSIAIHNSKLQNNNWMNEMLMIQRYHFLPSHLSLKCYHLLPFSPNSYGITSVVSLSKQKSSENNSLSSHDQILSRPALEVSIFLL